MTQAHICPKTTDGIDSGCLSAEFGVLHGAYHVLRFTYDAFSTDSNIEAGQADMEISYCPFCGQKL